MYLKRKKPGVPAAIHAARQVEDHSWTYAYYDRDGELLYVGVAVDAGGRATQHKARSVWWRFVAGGDAWLTPGTACARLECRLVKHCTPLFNVKMANWWADLDAAEYSARREAWDIVDDLLDVLSVTGRRVGLDAAGLRPPRPLRRPVERVRRVAQGFLAEVAAADPWAA